MSRSTDLLFGKPRQVTLTGESQQTEYEGSKLNAFIGSLNLPAYLTQSDKEQETFLQKFDATELWTGLNDLMREIGLVKLENYILIDFLEKNDPKALLGLERQRQLAKKQILRKLSEPSIELSRPSMFSKQSRVGPSVAKTVYILNMRAKCEMAEKVCVDMVRHIREMKISGIRQLKKLYAQNEEFRCDIENTKELIQNFKLHFLSHANSLAFLENATVEAMQKKHNKFYKNWIKNASALIGTMRLKLNKLDEIYKKQNYDLITKSDLSAVLGVVDYHLLEIREKELLVIYKNNTDDLLGLKGMASRVSQDMGVVKKSMIDLHNETKILDIKAIEVKKTMDKLEIETRRVEKDNVKALYALERAKSQSAIFSAPKAKEYIQIMDEHAALDKEDKMLDRKTNLLTMKLTNILKNKYNS